MNNDSRILPYIGSAFGSETHCYHCGVELGLFGGWAWRGHLFCSREHADTVGFVQGPIKSPVVAAIIQKAWEREQRRLGGVS